jgi:hypothetical protein
VLLNDVGPVDSGIDHGKRLQSYDGRLDEERHEAEPDTVFLLEPVLELLP